MQLESELYWPGEKIIKNIENKAKNEIFDTGDTLFSL